MLKQKMLPFTSELKRETGDVVWEDMFHVNISVR